MKTKNYTIELLRIIAIWAVVAIHTTSKTLTVVGFQYSDHALLALYVNQFMRFAVPLFFLISGYVLMARYGKQTKVAVLPFYKKRFVKLFIPYTLWSGIYYIAVNHNSIAAFLVNLPSLLFYGSAADQLYFIPSILLLYLLFPFLLKFLHKYPFHQNTFFYVTGFFASTIFLFVDYYQPHLLLPTPLRIALLNFPLFFLGMIFTQQKKPLKKIIQKYTVTIATFFIISLFFVIFEGKMLYFGTYTKNSEFFTSQWRPTVFIYTIGLFLLSIRYISIQKRYNGIIDKISSLTFFVFFIHLVFVHIFWKLFGAYLFSVSIGKIGQTLWFDPFAFFFVLCCSYASAFVVSKIPAVKNVLGVNP